jgi:hypothetical protein
MTDDESFIQAFETGQIAPDAFHHADHVRLAFAYLGKYSALEALSKFCIALKHFAAAHGKAERYHETITCAYFFLINQRKTRGRFNNWQEFSRENPDLLRWKNGILSRYYQQLTLDSDLARRIFVFPDKF